MATAKLVIRPDGRAILAINRRLSQEALFHLAETIRGWNAGEWPIAVIEDCEVVQVGEVELELELDPKVEAVS